MQKELFENINSPLFDYFFISAIYNNQEFGIFVYRNDSDKSGRLKVVPFLDEFVESGYIKKEELYKTHLYISVTEQYYKFLNDENNKKFLSRIKLPSLKEQQILQFMSKYKFDNVNIKWENNRAFLTGQFKIKANNGTDFKKFKRQIKNNYPYCNITEVQHQGKLVNLEISINEIIST